MSVPVESDETPNTVLQTTVFNTVEANQKRLDVLEKAGILQTNSILASTVTNGDTTHAPTGDAVFDADTAVAAAAAAALAAKTLTTTASLNFPLIAAGTVQTLTVTLTGAVANDAVVLGPPAALEAGLIGFGRVSAADTITIRLFNGTAAGVDPAAATWRVTIIR